MADPHIVSQLRSKRDQLERHISYLEDQAKAARVDLAHVSATLRLFEIGDEPHEFPIHMDLSRLFKRGELWGLCREALTASGEPRTTRELAAHVVAAKGWSADDKPLRSAVAYRIVQALTMQMKRGKVTSGGKRKGLRVWAPIPLQPGAVASISALQSPLSVDM